MDLGVESAPEPIFPACLTRAGRYIYIRSRDHEEVGLKQMIKEVPSLVRKLGLKAGMKAALLAAPGGFAETLHDLPPGIEVQTRVTKSTNLVLWFVRSLRELEREAGFISVSLPAGSSLWIIHPKQSSRFKADFNQNDVRKAGLAAGLVDYKICSVDADWSGLKFARRKNA